MKINSHLIIEVTRRCNTICKHCLRGKAENKDINITDMENVLKQFDYIDGITFTGGEPSLNPQAIKVFIELCKKHNVRVGNFGITTNAIQASDEFLHIIMDLWLFCDDNSRSRLLISNDIFHKYNNSPREINRLKTFSFTSMFLSEPENQSITYLNQGYHAKNSGDGEDIIPIDINNLAYNDFQQGRLDSLEIHLNCNGEVILGCSWSYENQGKYMLCKADESIYAAVKRKRTPNRRYGYNG